MRRTSILLLLLALPAVAQAKRPGMERIQAAAALEKARDAVGPDHFALATWHSDALSGDALGDPGTARVGLQLPAREKECLQQAAKCWLVFYLPGFDGSPESFHQGASSAPPSALAGHDLEVWRSHHVEQPSLSAEVEALNARPGAAPIVVVVPDGRTRLGGGWYVDSPTSGRWETFVIDVLLPAARETLAPGTPPERVILMGHSMGGFGALYLALKHPHAVHAVAAFSPAARTVDVADEALAKLDAHHEAPDPDARVKEPGPHHFFERILLSMGGAFFPDRRAPHGLPPLFDASKHPWKLSPAARAAFERYDVGRRAKELRPLAKVQLYAGRADPLIPIAQVQAIADAANGTVTPPAGVVGLDAGAAASAEPKQVELIATEGNHLSHLAEDLRRALETLAR